MDVSTIIALSRKQTSATVWQISDADYLKYLNIVYKDIFSILGTNSKKYTWNTFTTNIVADQKEYVLPRPDTNKTWMSLLLDCFYNGKKIPVYDSTMNRYIEESNGNPYWVLRDGSIFLYPTPKENITWGLVLEGRYIPLDLKVTDWQSDIKLEPQYHNILVQWLNALIFGEKQIFDKQQIWDGYYRASIKSMQSEWAMENESAYHVIDPNLSFLE